MKFQIEFYQNAAGKSPVREWLSQLDTKIRSRLGSELRKMENGLLGDTRHIGEGIWEKRIHFGPGYRFYYVFSAVGEICILAGGTKSSQRRDITEAGIRRCQLMEREGRG